MGWFGAWFSIDDVAVGGGVTPPSPPIPIPSPASVLELTARDHVEEALDRLPLQFRGKGDNG